MLIREVKPYEIPIRLLLQKPHWDLEAFYRITVVATNCYGFVWGNPGEEWAAMILVDDPVYQSVFCDTVIVDEESRALVPEVVRSGCEKAKEVAQQLGRKYLVTATRNPNRYLRMLGNPKGIDKLETRYRMEV